MKGLTREPVSETKDRTPLRLTQPSPLTPTRSEALHRSRTTERFLERRRAEVLGHELPLNTEEAASYLNLNPKTVARLAREGAIPAHPVSGVRRRTWRFYPSELDAWLHARLNSVHHPCSPDGKEVVQ